MEAKRSAMQTMQPKIPGSKTQMIKTGSDVSLSPSQASEQAKLNSRKNPLDALSRMSIRHETVQKRSGLQDVDDEYMKNNVFSRHAFPRHSGLADDYGLNNQARMTNANAAQPPLIPTESTFKLKTGADGGGAEMASQGQAQAQAQAQAQPPPQQHQHQGHGQQQQQQQQLHAHVQPAQMPCKNQTFNANQPNIIHSNATTPKQRDAESSSLTSPHFVNEVIEALGAELEDLHTNHQLDGDPSVAEAAADCGFPADAAEMTSSTAPLETAAPAEEQQHVTSSAHENHTPKAPSSVSDSGSGDNFMNMKKPVNFQLSKQHTGMKNMSFGVGMAVTPTNKMEFDQEAREEFGVVKITRPVGSTLNSPSAPPEQTDAMSTVSSAGEGLTDQGYYDLKFYHNKLW